jgi:hypothetical protein
VSSQLVEVVKRDLKEVVEAEIKRFLEHYEECKVVDAVFTDWHVNVHEFNHMIHGLPCSIETSFIFSGTAIHEIKEVTCYIDYKDEEYSEGLGLVYIIRFADKCFADYRVHENDISELAERIVREAEAGE